MNPWAVLALALVLIPYWMICRWGIRLLVLYVIQAGMTKNFEKFMGGKKQ